MTYSVEGNLHELIAYGNLASRYLKRESSASFRPYSTYFPILLLSLFLGPDSYRD